MAILKVVSAFKQYKSKSDSKVVLSDFHMNVKTGSIYALMGASGCGKTTLISCLVGMCQLDRGEIQVFDDSVGKNNAKIGYMPQEIALIGEFTISEMLHFYGVIFGMKKEKIEERLRFLSDLLELPDDDKLIEKCSGGQQRRISFAVALVHEPELLILDEPTVGVDPLLRSKIWDHMIDLSRTKNVTILMTTHYIEEARQSTHVGLMRKGLLIAQDTPSNLLEKCGTESLEEAFLKLSGDQEVGNQSQNFLTTQDLPEHVSIKQSSKNSKSKAEFFAPTSGRKLRALIMKNFIQVIRNPGFLLFAIFLPMIGIICLHNTMGGNPKGLLLGIVNGEAVPLDCSNRSLKTFEIEEYECHLKKISCRFINEIQDSVAIKKYYANRDEAEYDARRGNLIGFIQFSRNFSDSFGVLKHWDDLVHSEYGHIQVYLDNTDLQIVTFLQRNLFAAYHRFVESLMNDCKKSTKAGSIPMVVETFHGKLDDEFKQTMVPGLLFATFFMIASYLTSLALIEDRRSGIWNRTLTAGATPHQFLISHLVIGTCLMAIQALEFIVYAIYIGNDSHRWSFILLVSSLIFLLGFAGTLYGLCISVLTDSTLVATYFSIVITYPFLSLSGIFWPLEGVPSVLKYFGYMLPFTFPSRAFMNIMFSDVPFSDNTAIALGFWIIAGWVFVELIVCFWFSRSSGVKKK